MHDTPSMLRKLEQLTGVNPETIPLGDKDTMKLFSEGRTNGVPEFYTDLVKQMMKTIGVKSFDDLMSKHNEIASSVEVTKLAEFLQSNADELSSGLNSQKQILEAGIPVFLVDLGHAVAHTAHAQHEKQHPAAPAEGGTLLIIDDDDGTDRQHKTDCL